MSCRRISEYSPGQSLAVILPVTESDSTEVIVLLAAQVFEGSGLMWNRIPVTALEPIMPAFAAARCDHGAGKEALGRRPDFAVIVVAHVPDWLARLDWRAS